MSTQSLAIPIPQINTKKQSAKRLSAGSLSLDELFQTPEMLALDEWAKAHPEEDAQLQQEVLEEMGLAH